MRTICIAFSSWRANIVCLVLCFSFLGQRTLAQNPFDYGWQVGYGYSVGATLVKGDTMYIGGDFDYVGHYTGSMVQASLTGTGTISASWPVVNDTIRVMIRDGQGGWFIGGDFTLVDGYSRKGLARIDANHKLDLSWNINVNSGAHIAALLLSPTTDTLWVGGTFTTIGGVASNKVAAIKTATKSVISGWGPGTGIGDNWWAPGTGTVCALAYYPANPALSGDVSKLFIGGDFRNAAWQEADLTALNPTTGTVISSWKSNLNHYSNMYGKVLTPVVRSLLIEGRNLYIGGLFSTITDKNKTSTRQSLAMMDAYADTLFKLDAKIVPQNDSGLVNCMKFVYCPRWGGYALAIGGKFRDVGGSLSAGLKNFTTVHKVTGDAYPYGTGGITSNGFVNGYVVDTTVNPGVYALGEIYSFDTVGTKVYLAGNFEGIKGDASSIGVRRNLAVLDMNSSMPGIWGPIMQTDRAVYAVNISGNDVIITGSFTSAGGELRRNMAAVDLKKDIILSCNPLPDSYVNSFVLSPAKDILYIGGNFANVGSVQRGYTAAMDVGNNSILPWTTSTGAGGGVEDMQLDASRNILYVGGKFTKMGGQNRNHLAALDARNGTLIGGWLADVTTINGQITPVRTLALSPTKDTLYVGGRFDQIAGASRTNLAAIKTTFSGPVPATAAANLLNWDFPAKTTVANSDIGVCTLSLYNGMLFVGGKYDALGGNSSLQNLAAIDVSGPVHTINASWAPKVEYGGVWCMQPVGSALYIGGDFGSLNGTSTSFAAALNISDASMIGAWVPYPTRGLGGVILSLMVNNPYVYLGGNQEAMTQNVNDGVYHLATIPSLDLNLLPGIPQLAVKNTASGNLINWQTEWTNTSITLERSSDGIHYATILPNAAAGGRYIDALVLPGKTYFYRLKNTAGNGLVTYSIIRSVTVARQLSLLVPAWVNATNQLRITMAGTEREQGLITIVTSSGQQVMRQNLKQGINEIKTTQLPRGAYFYSVTVDGWPAGSGKFLLQ